MGGALPYLALMVMCHPTRHDFDTQVVLYRVYDLPVSFLNEPFVEAG